MQRALPTFNTENRHDCSNHMRSSEKYGEAPELEGSCFVSCVARVQNSLNV